MQPIFQLWQRNWRTKSITSLVCLLVALAFRGSDSAFAVGRENSDDERFLVVSSEKESTGVGSQRAGDRETTPMRAPKEIVERFLELATHDAWLTNEGRKELGELMGWKYSPGKANLVLVNAIAGYRIVAAVSKETSAEVEVEYEEIGWLDEDFYRFHEERKKNVVRFLLDRDDKGNWKITTFGWDSPHIHWSSIVEHLERLQIVYSDNKYKKLIEQVRNAAKQPSKNQR